MVDILIINGDSVGDTITRVEDDTGGTTRGIEGEHGLNGDIHGRGRESLEHDLGHLLAVSLGVKGSLSQKDGVLLRGNTELVEEGVVPKERRKQRKSSKSVRLIEERVVTKH